MREKRDRNKLIMEKIERGEYLVDIAKEFKISPPMVSKIKRRYKAQGRLPGGAGKKENKQNNKTMTIKELKEELENFDEDLIVQIAEQPHYPFAYSIQDIKREEDIIYIVEGTQKGGLPKELFDQLFIKGRDGNQTAKKRKDKQRK